MPLPAALLLSACGSGPRVSGVSPALECVPFARQVSGIQLRGEAYTWWEGAANRYRRGTRPVPGGVLVFRRSARLPLGHVSVVSRVVSDREITVTQANWMRRRITREDPVIDVSAGNDWSAVRVWWAPSGAMGRTVYPSYGFIAPDRADGTFAAGQARSSR